MRLSDRERAVLGAINLNANLSHAEVAKQVGIAPHAVRYVVQRLFEKRVIARRWIIDSYALGWFRCVFFLSTKLSDRATKKKFLGFVVNDSRTAYIAELGGQFNCLISIFAKNVSDVLSFQEDIHREFGQIIESKSLSFRTYISSYSRFGETFKSRKRNLVTFRTRDSVEELDALDQRVVTTLGAATSETHRDLAKLTKLPLSTFEYRLESLKRRKVVLGQCYAVNSTLYGSRSYILSFYSRGFASNLRDTLERYAFKNPCVVAFLDGVGEWDFDFDVEVESSDQVQAMKDELSELLRDQLREIRITPVFKVYKTAFFPQAKGF